MRPGALPCQLLDHATGYLDAAGAFTALGRRARTGDIVHVTLSLSRTAQWLLDQDRPTQLNVGDDSERQAANYRIDFGNGWSGISPPGLIDPRPLCWPHLTPAYGEAALGWS